MVVDEDSTNDNFNVYDSIANENNNDPIEGIDVPDNADVSNYTIDISIHSNSKGFPFCTNACSDTINVSIHNNNNACSDVIDVDSHNNSRGFLFGNNDNNDNTDTNINTNDNGSDPSSDNNNNNVKNDNNYDQERFDLNHQADKDDTENALVSILSDRRIMNNNGEYITNITNDTINNGIHSNSKRFLVCTDACSDVIDVDTHNNNNNNDTCSGVIYVDIHNNNKRFLFSTFNEVHYGDDIIDKKDSKNNNDESTTVDNTTYITSNVCSDAIDVGIHNNSDDSYSDVINVGIHNNNDDAYSGAIDVGIHNNNKGYYFGTFDEIHYDDETAPTVSVKSEKKDRQLKSWLKSRQ